MILQLENIETFYGSSQALFGLSLTIGANEVVTLIGRNGMGKTTTVNSVMGIVPPRHGKILFDDKEITGRQPHQIANAGIGLVPEGRQVFPNLTVRENLLVTGKTDGAQGWSFDKVLTLFPELAQRQQFMANLLSGGEQQMLAVARALMLNPKLLILDEATEGLAPLVRHAIWDCLKRLKAQGQAILVIDKNLNDLMQVADRHYVIEKGRIIWTGTTAALAEKRADLVSALGV